jgi:hypothetical protein
VYFITLAFNCPVDNPPRRPVDKYTVDSIHTEVDMSTQESDEAMKWAAKPVGWDNVRVLSEVLGKPSP